MLLRCLNGVVRKLGRLHNFNGLMNIYKKVVYGGGNIVFGAKRSNHWMQWMRCTQWNSGIWWWVPGMN